MRPVADQVRANYRDGGYAKAAKAVRVTQTYGSRGASVRIRVDRRRAEYAATGATFRHPVFGDRSNWVSQPTVHEPFDRAVEGAAKQQAVRAIDAVAKTIERRAGFR